MSDGGTIDIRALVSISRRRNSFSSASRSSVASILVVDFDDLAGLRRDVRFLYFFFFGMGIGGGFCRRCHLARRFALLDVGGMRSSALLNPERRLLEMQRREVRLMKQICGGMMNRLTQNEIKRWNRIFDYRYGYLEVGVTWSGWTWW